MRRLFWLQNFLDTVQTLGYFTVVCEIFYLHIAIAQLVDRAFVVTKVATGNQDAIAAKFILFSVYLPLLHESR